MLAAARATAEQYGLSATDLTWVANMRKVKKEKGKDCDKCLMKEV